MKKVHVSLIALFFCVFSSLVIGQSMNNVATTVGTREHLLMDFGWRFALGHATDVKKDFNHATGYFSYFAMIVCGGI